jgi:ubiquinone/menaquinone biosynthesis C-methylase UbiE
VEVPLPVEAQEYNQSTYDKVAEAYDNLWSRNVAAPNAKLTRLLDLRPGERVADLACGTGVDTVDMARRVAPGEVIGVDYSEGMLAGARERAAAEGLPLTLVHAKAEDFIVAADPASFDAVSMRFACAYLEWTEVLPQFGRIMRPGGRVAVLTSLASSIPQFMRLYREFKGSIEPVWKLFQHNGRSFADTVRMFRQLRSTFGNGEFICVPDSTETVSRYLAQGGLVTTEAFVDRIRLYFPTGMDVVRWMHASGYVTHHSLDLVGPHAVRFIETLFADGLEEFREARGIPLDLVVAGVVAEKRS